LHYPVAWGLSKIDKRLSLPGLIVGSFMPDIEVPILFLFFEIGIDNHFILHSLVGVLTIGTLLSILATVLLYPIFASLIFRVDKNKVKEACKLTPILVFSCMLGNVFHILLDLPMHPYSFILWPFVDPNNIVGFLVLAFAPEGDLTLGFLFARILNNIIMGSLMLAIVIKSRKNLWEQIIVGK
jgi:membrane-bound metal-dependent hydrolase YbcI (DUF457 family)